MNDAKKFFEDLYRDLSDRNLLLPAIVLVVAILAVPMLLKSSPAETAPAPVPPVANADASEVKAAVVTADPGIRDYSQRLEALKKKNPFVQQFADEASPLGESTDIAGGPVAPTSSTAPPTDTGAPVPGAGDTSGDVSPPSTGSPDTTTTPPSEPSTPEIKTRFYAPRVDVTFGELGDAKEIKDVRYFDFLPSQKNPVVAFLGLGESADKAVFAISNEVATTDGEGSCTPHEADGCDLLILRIGQERNLKLVDGRTYRLKVIDTHFTRIPDPREGGDDGSDGSSGAGTQPGLRAH